MNTAETVPFDEPDVLDMLDEGDVPDEPIRVPDSTALLNSVRDALQRYVVLPSDEAEVAVVLWIVATHAVDRFDHATRLAVHSPVKRCGKSRLLEIIAGLAHKPMQTTNISVAALFRMVDAAGDHPPTLILDEADRLFGGKKDEDNADLVAMLNNGFRRGSPTYRCVGAKLEPKEFQNFAFAAIAGIGRLPDTIEDRAVNVTMRRRLPGESVAKFRLGRDLPRLHELRDVITAWAAENIRDDGSDVDVPDELEDRAQDCWEPLLVVADAAGGEWPRSAREAAVKLTRESAEDDSDQSWEDPSA